MIQLDDVATVPWPDDDAELAAMLADRRPRIFLVPASADPPELEDDFVDWVREGADSRDIDARMRCLLRRVQGGRHWFRLDPFGRLHYGDRWVMIHSSVERGLLGLMLPRMSEVVSFDELFEAGWANGNASANALRVQMTRMNRRLAPVGLAARGIRNAGYVLDDVRFVPDESVGS